MQNNNRQSISSDRGFTLIELLVVISIIGILIALSLFGIKSAREASRDAKRKSDLEAMRSALELYKADCGKYPTQFPSPGDPLFSCNGEDVEYLSSWPEDPLSSSGRKYSAQLQGLDVVIYYLCASLENPPSNPGNPGNCDCGSDSGYICNYVVYSP